MKRQEKETRFHCVCAGVCPQRVTCTTINSSCGSQCRFDMIKKGFFYFGGSWKYSTALTSWPGR